MYRTRVLVSLLLTMILVLTPVASGENRQSTIDGNAFEFLPTDSTGELSVIVQGVPDERGLIPFVIRNDTAQQYGFIRAVVTARDTSGNAIRENDNLGASHIQPQWLLPGQIAIGYVSAGDIFSYTPDPEGTTYDISLQPVMLELDIQYPNYQLTDFERDGDTFRGDIGIDSPQTAYLFFAVAVCFTSDGLISHSGLSITFQEIEGYRWDGAEIVFEDGVGECDRFLIAAGEI